MIRRKPNLSPEMHAALDEWEAARDAALQKINEGMSMTTQQFSWLRWFAKHGGTGRVDGYQVIAADRSPSGSQAVIAFLHLVAEGAIAGGSNELVITDHGRRCLERTETEPLPLEPPP